MLPMAHTVLIAEDEALVAAVLEDIVIESGMVPIGPCPSRESVIAVAGITRPDIALIDIRLGRDRGHDICEYLHQTYQTACVYVTGSMDLAKANRRGALGVLIKPFRIDDLKQVLEYLKSVRVNEAAQCPSCLIQYVE
jgi:response regulator of citrate/malate metabolism